MDLTYTQDKMFTRFYPESEAGEDVWREIANKMNGVAAVLNFEAKSIIAQIRAAGYSIVKSTPKKVTNEEIDKLLAELAA